jgi:hypothetical protein
MNWWLQNPTGKGRPFPLFAGRYSVGLSSGTSGNKGLTVLSPAEREAYGCLLFARNGIPDQI